MSTFNEGVWDAGYEAASNASVKGHSQDATDLFVLVRDVRVPYLTENDADFWPVFRMFCAGVDAYKENAES